MKVKLGLFKVEEKNKSLVKLVKHYGCAPASEVEIVHLNIDDVMLIGCEKAIIAHKVVLYGLPNGEEEQSKKPKYFIVYIYEEEEGEEVNPF